MKSVISEIRNWDHETRFNPEILELLEPVFGKSVNYLTIEIAIPPNPYVIRNSCLNIDRMELIEKLRRFNVKPVKWKSLPHAIEIPWSGPHEIEDYESMKSIVVDKFAAEAVLMGSDLYFKGVLKTPKLTTNEEAIVIDPTGILVGKGRIEKNLGSRDFSRNKKGIYLSTKSSIYNLPPLSSQNEFNEGLFYAQSIPSMLVPLLTDAYSKSNDRIIEFCAAPGGKSTYLAELNQHREIISVDRSKNRIETLNQHKRRLKLTNITTVIDTVSSFQKNNSNMKFSNVLIDPPCSALGIKPKLYSTITKNDILSLAKYQTFLLSIAKRFVKPRGYLTYSTCTMTLQENEMQIEKLVKSKEFVKPEIINFNHLKKKSAKDIKNNHPNGIILRFNPIKDKTIGFFIALIKKS
ncbi:MAG: methyltransferase domain-containing protein [Candidatus Ranarchaeia archaeon]